jgi:hypothetical protein
MRPVETTADQRHQIADRTYLLRFLVGQSDAEVILDIHHDFDRIKTHDSCRPFERCNVVPDSLHKTLGHSLPQTENNRGPNLPKLGKMGIG